MRLDVSPTANNGLRAVSRLMVDKISTVPRSRIGDRVGYLDDEDIVRLDQALLVFLGLTAWPRIGIGE